MSFSIDGPDIKGDIGHRPGQDIEFSDEERRHEGQDRFDSGAFKNVDRPGRENREGFLAEGGLRLPPWIEADQAIVNQLVKLQQGVGPRHVRPSVNLSFADQMLK